MNASDMLSAQPVQVVVLGDFGRAAAIRFCHILAQLEKEHILNVLGQPQTFYDEYRRITLSLVGDLRFVKHQLLESYRTSGAALDDRILVGFEGGLVPQQVAEGLGVLAFHAMTGPLQRGRERILVLLPCNTLAPISWHLENIFSSARDIVQLLGQGGVEAPLDLSALAEHIEDKAQIEFPTVPEAVLRELSSEPFTAIFPLGTKQITDIYTLAAKRLGSDISIIGTQAADHPQVLAAINACISGDVQARSQARSNLERIANETRARHAEPLAVVSACTDLDVGVGLDSSQLYARAIVRMVYAS